MPNKSHGYDWMDSTSQSADTFLGGPDNSYYPYQNGVTTNYSIPPFLTNAFSFIKATLSHGGTVASFAKSEKGSSLKPTPGPFVGSSSDGGNRPGHNTSAGKITTSSTTADAATFNSIATTAAAVTSANAMQPVVASTNATSLTSAGVSTATGVKTTQIALGADVATSLYGVTGAGLKIGIISDSFNAKGGAAADMTAGILPNVTVLSDKAGTDEGRAMLELAYSIAPGATYYTADGGSLADNVTALQAAGVNIIIDDLSVGGEGLYQVGSATDVSIENAVAKGVNYFTSAGNNGNDYYEQGFTPLTTSIKGIGNVTANNFGGDSPFLSLTLPSNFTSKIVFQFAQPYSSFPGNTSTGPTNSLAIYLLDASGNIVGSSTENDLGGDPTQEIDFNNTTSNTAYQLVVVQNGGIVPTGQLFKFFLSDNNGTINSPNAGKGSGDLLGHELLNNINVVGSVPYSTTPAFGVSPAQIDPASSVGPGTILFDANGNSISPVTQGVPQFEAPDGTTTGTANTGFATDPFFGTSAAAPSAGAVSALILQANTALTTSQVTSVLAQSVIPVTTKAPSSGAGLIQARAAVEIAAADAGDRWATIAGGNWNSTSSWSGGAAPTDAQAVSLSDNLGSLTGSYTVTVNTANAAGSLAISEPAGSSVTLNVAAGGVLTVGLPGATSSSNPANDITSGDLLVSDNGVLTVTGGTIIESGSLNVNNGTVTVSLGSVTANNYAQNSGQISIGGSIGSARLNLTGTGFTETGGAASILSSGFLNTTAFSNSAGMFSTASGGTLSVSSTASFGSNAIFNNAGSFNDTGTATFLTSTITDSGSFTVGSASISQSTFTETGALVTTGALIFDDTTATVAKGATVNVGSLGVGSTLIGFTPSLTIAGKVIDAGSLGIGSSVTAGNVVIQSGGELDVGGANASVGITFTGNGLLAYTSSTASVLTNQEKGIISGLSVGNGAIDFTGLNYDSADSLEYFADNGQVLIADQSGNAIVNVYLNTGVNYTGLLKLQSDGATNHLELIAACYRIGTMITTDRGEILIEDLQIGDTVTTASGAQEPIHWIGRRSYRGRFMAANRDVLPVCVKAGALGKGVPLRDLWISPKHAMFIDGFLIPAVDLVNGVSIIQDMDCRDVQYVHLELLQHDVILAEGAPSESFVDDNSRMMFHNAAEYADLYPDAKGMPAMYCAPRVTGGYELEAILQKLGEIAGIREAPALVPLRGFIDFVDSDRVEGWAQNPETPEAPVCLDVVLDSKLLTQTLANRRRPDLATAGVGSGNHAFVVRLPISLTREQCARVEVRRSSDQMGLQASQHRLRSLARAA